MLLRPIQIDDEVGSPATRPADRRRPVVVTVGGAEFTTCFLDVPGELLLVVPPAGTEEVAAGLDGRQVEVRWRTGDGVARARGMLSVEHPGRPWTIRPDQPLEVSDERLFRRVPVRVPVSLMAVRGGQPVAATSRTVNVSVGGLAVEHCPTLDLGVGDAVAVGIDPADGRVLAGGTVIGAGSGDVAMRIRFEQISLPQQDRLVGFINREELRCSLR